MEDSILREIFQEHENQINRWGLQNHPSVDVILSTRKGGCSSERMCEEYEIPSEARAKFICETAARKKEITWSHIAVEELSEVISCENDISRRDELIQLAAVIYSWIDSIDRNSTLGIRNSKINNIIHDREVR